jgi:ribosomal protein S18 acetylase RimI-like enzyme
MSPSCAVHETARVWLILDESETAGYIALTFAFSFEFGGWYGFIDELYLREPFRRRGWGTQAVELAASTCRELGMRALLLEADVGNQAATRLYRRLGFIEHRRRLMRRTL